MDAVENAGRGEAPDTQGRRQLAHQDMDKKKNKRTKKASRRGAIYVSPDGGHTVYEQNRDGSRGRLVEEDSHARMLNELQQDSDMFGFEAYALRRKYPTLKKAYDNYKAIWHLVNDNDSN